MNSDIDHINKNLCSPSLCRTAILPVNPVDVEKLNDILYINRKDRNNNISRYRDRYGLMVSGQSINSFTFDEDWKENNISYFKGTNKVGREIFRSFLSECCEYPCINSYTKQISFVSRHDMYERYKVWCSDRGFTAIGGNIFMEMSDSVFDKRRYKKKWYYIKVRLR